MINQTTTDDILAHRAWLARMGMDRVARHIDLYRGYIEPCMSLVDLLDDGFRPVRFDLDVTQTNMLLRRQAG
jgi:hypothetical protein